ncbi:MAG: hypothetical protein WCB19_04850 [Thermoplasmata archaeon]
MGLRNVRGDIGLFRGDVGLLREGLSLISEFGLRSTERLAFVADFLERSVYAPKSLRGAPGGVGFTLLNPPLRVGAFSCLRVAWDGAFLPPERAFVLTEGHATERPLADITLSRPIELRPGQRIEFRLTGIPADSGRHRVRLELQNIAVPPLVWFEFADTISESAHP